MRKNPERGAPATIADVAQLAGVGTMTVSRVINQSGYVGKDTALRVQKAIAKLGFRPNETARSLKGGKSKTIGIIVPDLSDIFFALCANEAQKVAVSHGYLSLIGSGGRAETTEMDEIGLMLERNISGLIIAPTLREWPPLLELAARGTPIVTFDRRLSGFDSDVVLADNSGGGYVATRHLIEHGHTHIACVGYDEATVTVQDRIAGYRKAIQEAGISEYTYTSVDSQEKIAALLRTWAANLNRPTAVFTLNNISTMNFYLACRQVGVSIPNDYALIGFGDLEFWTLFACSVTAVRQPSAELGKRAADMLFARLRTSERQTAQQIVLPVELIVRNSCGCK